MWEVCVFYFPVALHERSRMCTINKDVWEHTCQSSRWTQGKQPKAVMAGLDLSLLLMLSVLVGIREVYLAQFSHQGAMAPGDIIIGGLFPIHEAVVAVNYTGSNSFSPPQRPNCSRWVFKNITQKMTELIIFVIG